MQRKRKAWYDPEGHRLVDPPEITCTKCGVVYAKTLATPGNGTDKTWCNDCWRGSPEHEEWLAEREAWFAERRMR